jgi:hypothetical protein
MIGIPDEADQLLLEIAHRAVVRANRQRVISALDYKEVEVFSPKHVRVVLHDHTVFTIPQGYSKVPRHIAAHWFAEANGVAEVK